MMRWLTSLLILLMLPQSVLRVNVDLQQIVVTVRDDQGRLVKNLKPEDLTIEDNGVPQKIAHFVQDSETPVSLGILIDTSGSMAIKPAGGTISALRAAVGTTRLLLKLMKPSDEFLLMSFDNSFEVRQSFTQDTGRIDTSLRRLQSQGGTDLFPAVESGLHEIRKAHNRKKALIVITDAMANGNYNALQRAIRESEGLIYTFAIQGTNSSLRYPIAIAAGPRGSRGTNVVVPPAFTLTGFGINDTRVLDVLAGESGGVSQVFDLNSDKLIERMVEFVQEIAAELRGQYTIGYYPQASSTENHSIRVRAVSRNHHVRFQRALEN